MCNMMITKHMIEDVNLQVCPEKKKDVDDKLGTKKKVGIKIL